jgi:hypothetical protein
MSATRRRFILTGSRAFAGHRTRANRVILRGALDAVKDGGRFGICVALVSAWKTVKSGESPQTSLKRWRTICRRLLSDVGQLLVNS